MGIVESVAACCTFLSLVYHPHNICILWLQSFSLQRPFLLHSRYGVSSATLSACIGVCAPGGGSRPENVEPSVNRDADPPCLRAAYGTVLRKARGGTDGQALKSLRAAKAAWEQELNNKGPQGRPAGHEAVNRIASSAVLLTYQSFTSLD